MLPCVVALQYVFRNAHTALLRHRPAFQAIWQLPLVQRRPHPRRSCLAIYLQTCMHQMPSKLHATSLGCGVRVVGMVFDSVYVLAHSHEHLAQSYLEVSRRMAGLHGCSISLKAADGTPIDTNRDAAADLTVPSPAAHTTAGRQWPRLFRRHTPVTQVDMDSTDDEATPVHGMHHACQPLNPCAAIQRQPPAGSVTDITSDDKHILRQAISPIGTHVGHKSGRTALRTPCADTAVRRDFAINITSDGEGVRPTALGASLWLGEPTRRPLKIGRFAAADDQMTIEVAPPVMAMLSELSERRMTCLPWGILVLKPDVLGISEFEALRSRNGGYSCAFTDSMFAWHVSDCACCLYRHASH